jgi:hypothetical protein
VLEASWESEERYPAAAAAARGLACVGSSRALDVVVKTEEVTSRDELSE